MRSTFDGQLKALNNAMITMGAQCEDAIAKAAKSFLENDKELAGKVPGIAERIEHSEREIESMCLKLLLMQQPVASLVVKEADASGEAGEVFLIHRPGGLIGAGDRNTASLQQLMQRGAVGGLAGHQAE